MTDKQPEALRLADFLEAVEVGAHTTRRLDEAAAELRRLHQSEREAWRYADELEQERKRLSEINAELVEALEYVIKGVPSTWVGVVKAQTILEKTKEENNG